jgi:RimJ/RimL family protein N-acetyltransferase
MEHSELGPDGNYSCRLLGPPDIAAVQGLFERATDYFEVATGAPAAADEAERAFVAGPPTKSVDDKRSIGIFDDQDSMVGVIDALIDWPDPDVWSVGMLLLDPGHRGKGLGAAALTEFENWSGRLGATKLRTAIVAHHEDGVAFAYRAGYRPDKTLEDYDAGSRQARVLFFEKKLKQ